MNLRRLFGFLLVPIVPTSPVYAFVVCHLGMLRVYGGCLRERGSPMTVMASGFLIASYFLLSSFASMFVWRMTCRWLAYGLGDLDEPALGPNATKATRWLGILGCGALLVSLLF